MSKLYPEKRYNRICKICGIESLVLKRNINKICGSCNRKQNKPNLGKYPPNRKNIDLLKLTELYNLNYSQKDIGEFFNVDRIVIKNRIKELNLPKRNKKEFHRLKVKEKMSGDKNPSWNGGTEPENKKLRESTLYSDWRNAVFKRDNYTCINCNSKNNLECDHINPWSIFPDLRFNVDNGRTLCHACHSKTPTYRKNKKYLKQLYNLN